MAKPNYSKNQPQSAAKGGAPAPVANVPPVVQKGAADKAAQVGEGARDAGAPPPPAPAAKQEVVVEEVVGERIAGKYLKFQK